MTQSGVPTQLVGTGSHQIRFGVQYSFGPAYYSANMNGDGWANFSNSVPVSYTAYDTPFYQRPYMNADLAPYAMDTRHIKRLTVTAGSFRIPLG